MTSSKSLFNCFISVALICFTWEVAIGQQNNEWPNLHGADRTNKSTETNLLQTWPETGPALLWTTTGLGEGYSSVAIAGGMIFTAGVLEKQSYVFAFDLGGNLIWKQPNGASWETDRSWARTYTGPRSTPTVSAGAVYHLGDTGTLTAFASKTGKEIWTIDLRESFEAEMPEYGYSESVYIDGDVLYCSPAGKKGFIVALNKKDGKLIWANAEIPGNEGYSSAIIAEFGSYRQVINFSSNSVFGVDAKSGKLLWRSEFENQRSLNCTDAIFHNGYVHISSGYGKGSVLLKLTASEGKIVPETVWQTELMDNHHGGVIFLNGYLYGSGSNSRGWFCLDFKTGEEKWKSRGKGSLTYADNRFYLLEESGILKLAKATPETYEEVCSFRVPDGGKGKYWAHPVVCGGRLYVRHADKLFVYDIKRK
jgi:outer membrane protein assembly factor BamB